MTELTLLADQIRVSERTLRRAIADGSLRAVRPTPRRLDMSLSERQYVRRSWPLLASLRAALRTEHNLRFALLFGSAAKGTDEATSDVDLLVDLRDSSLERTVDLSVKLAAATGRRIDLMRLDEAREEPSFLAEIIADGRVVVDREGLWPDLSGRQARLVEGARGNDVQRARAAIAGLDRMLDS